MSFSFLSIIPNHRSPSRRVQHRLEKTHAEYLNMFGPNGLLTPNGLRLIAPDFRGPRSAPSARGVTWLDGTGGRDGRITIPEDLLEGAKAISDMDQAPEELSEAEEKPKTKGKKKGKQPVRKMKVVKVESRPRQTYGISTQTPMSNTRSINNSFQWGQDLLDSAHDEGVYPDDEYMGDQYDHSRESEPDLGGPSEFPLVSASLDQAPVIDDREDTPISSDPPEIPRRSTRHSSGSSRPRGTPITLLGRGPPTSTSGYWHPYCPKTRTKLRSRLSLRRRYST